MVQGGDTVYVTPASYFYVSGEVLRPGRYRLERHTTVAKALAIAGGLSRFAAQRRLQVRRVVSGKPQDFHARMTDLLQSEDVLICRKVSSSLPLVEDVPEEWEISVAILSGS
jgi:protein involved in polysaccharide export with SLBB domain